MRVGNAETRWCRRIAYSVRAQLCAGHCEGKHCLLCQTLTFVRFADREVHTVTAKPLAFGRNGPRLVQRSALVTW